MILFEGDDIPTSKESAIVWLQKLWNSPFQYHIDDNPRDVIAIDKKSSCPGHSREVFNETQAAHAEACLAACGQYMNWDEIWIAYYRDPIAVDNERKRRNPNVNCLKGKRCPKCGSYGDFSVAATVWLHLSDDGESDANYDKEFDDHSPAQCRECDHTAFWGEFDDPNKEQENK